MRKPFDIICQQGADILIGREEQLRLTLTGLLAGGHCLVQDLPGVGKTTLVHLVSALTGLELNRIQFTSDLLPSDITGTHIYKDGEFTFKRGPLFGQLILADELNRAHPKTQSALLQAMEEHQVSIDDQTFELEEIFTVIATQNPLDQVGTHCLPESQLDRFVLSFSMNLPTPQEEKRILMADDARKSLKKLTPLIDMKTILAMREEVEKIHIEDDLLDYVLRVLDSLRNHEGRIIHISPRAAKDWIKTARVTAFLEERNYVVPDHLQQMAPYVFAHRVESGYELNKGMSLVRSVLEQVAL